MTGSEWKPGDVAMVSADNKRTPYRAYFDGKTWREVGSSLFCVDSPTSHRPLVVIDPEDREQVERLVKSAWPEAEAALRSLVTPPKPDEPTGRYAAVVDANGTEWLRTRDGHWAWVEQAGFAAKITWRDWDDIAAVKVLSEGVTP